MLAAASYYEKSPGKEVVPDLLFRKAHRTIAQVLTNATRYKAAHRLGKRRAPKFGSKMKEGRWSQYFLGTGRRYSAISLVILRS